MINSIKKILIEVGYKIVKEDDLFIFMRNSNEQKVDYYLVACIGSFTTCEEIRTRIEAIQNEFVTKQSKFEDASKNTTAILTMKIDNYELTEVQKRCIYEIEEEPYHLKQNVLYYTTNEEEFVKSLGGEGLVKKLYQIINNGKLFNQFKNNKENAHMYSIVAKLFIKLNCLKYTFGGDKKFTYLEGRIIKRLSDESEIGEGNAKSFYDCIGDIKDEQESITKYYDDAISVLGLDSDDIEKLIDERIVQLSKKVERK